MRHVGDAAHDLERRRTVQPRLQLGSGHAIS
jgi:hypothetical protein